MNDLRKRDVLELKRDIEETIKSLGLADKEKGLKLLESETLDENFWKDKEKAKETMSNISVIQDEIETARQLQDDIGSLEELFNSIEKETEQNNLIEDYLAIKAKLDKFSLRKFLSEEYDSLGAILSINAGQGGTESNDWVEMLYRMYTMFFDKQGWKHTTTEITKGSEAGLSSVTIQIEEPYSFGMLKKEHGVHRLVRISPYNAQGLRQTTFAGVEVLPMLKDSEESKEDLEIPEKDISFKAVRSSGPGGQSVNKTSSAVQITHIPTGITVHSSEHKSQAQNRKEAMRILKAKLWRIKEEKQVEKISEITGEQKAAAWGNQIRNYVLHPYKLVKDLRTEVESQNPEDVLDGDIEKFLEAQVRLQ
ncbi:MAG: peptide chain release factor 2 [Candidatus Dojkabacteria bacterium]